MKTDRIRMLMMGVFVLWGAMIFRTFQIQVVEGSDYGDRADNQSRRRVIWKPERGSIVDREGNLLATNQPVWIKNELVSKRLYPEGELACQLLGFTGRDGQGLQGLEYNFDDKLRGIDGWSYQTVDAHRRALPGMERKGRAPTPGMEMVLTIQRDYQEIVENALAKGVTQLDADRGSALLLDPNTGEVLARLRS
jgi:cell division protein FtsI/penicillin-binding protein 2